MRDFLKSWVPDREPGTAYEYSNLGVALLGSLLAEGYAGRVNTAGLPDEAAAAAATPASSSAKVIVPARSTSATSSRAPRRT